MEFPLTYTEMAKEKSGRSCSLEQLPTPGRRGDFPSIKVPIGAHKRGFDPNKFNLIMELGYFVKGLIDIDLAVPIPNKILVEVEEDTDPSAAGPSFTANATPLPFSNAFVETILEGNIKKASSNLTVAKIASPEPVSSRDKIPESSQTEDSFLSPESDKFSTANQPHQLLKETAIVRLQSALNWADMVDDVERDASLVAHDDDWHTVDKKKANQKKKNKSPSSGIKYYWSNGQLGKGRILRRLDRALSNNAWSTKFDGWACKYQPRENSDHAVLVGFAITIPKPNNIPFRFQKGFTDLKQALDACSHLSHYISDPWKAAVFNMIYLLWTIRNEAVFEGLEPKSYPLKVKLLTAIKDSAAFSSNFMNNNGMELSIVATLGVPTEARPIPRVQSCIWILPWFDEYKINCDGSATGNPGKAGIGAAARNHLGIVLGVLTKGLGITSSYYAECEAIIEVLSWAVIKGWLKLWIESDSLTTVTNFNNNLVPCPQRTRWNGLKDCFSSLRFSHNWREANFSSDTASKRANSLADGVMETFDG
ncbi:hypothetical protein GIB67_037736 [Kingdonia uniflora]|uniref:RNase H type-1 domain-containing protein n=1 Tax=Kingdonia uniflora TaxID=39325 RepID=A0A7J7LUV1_9MAGN|nr:hypothetical protein GIB67_037736 [Kingdonia uniflora]